MGCACAGTGWLCEEHPDKPMDHDGCRGAGMPCPSCNPSDATHPPAPPPGFRIDRDRDGSHH
jgi:hypothetical protein